MCGVSECEADGIPFCVSHYGEMILSHSRYKNVEKEIKKVLNGKATIGDLLKGGPIVAENLVGLFNLITKVVRLRRNHQAIFYPEKKDMGHESAINDYISLAASLKKMIPKPKQRQLSPPTPCPIMISTIHPTKVTTKRRKKKKKKPKRETQVANTDSLDIIYDEGGFEDIIRRHSIKEGKALFFWPLLAGMSTAQMIVEGKRESKIAKVFAKNPLTIQLKTGMELIFLEDGIWRCGDILYQVNVGTLSYDTICRQSLLTLEKKLNASTEYLNRPADNCSMLILEDKKITCIIYPISQWNISIFKEGKELTAQIPIYCAILDLLHEIVITWMKLTQVYAVDKRFYVCKLLNMFSVAIGCDGWKEMTQSYETKYPSDPIPEKIINCMAGIVDDILDVFQSTDLEMIYIGRYETCITTVFMFSLVMKAMSMMI